MYGKNNFSNTGEADARVVVASRECLFFTLERLFHPQVICSNPGGNCSRLEDVIHFLTQNHEQEERLMIETGYPMFATHKRKHKALMRTLKGMKRTLICGDYDSSMVAEFLTEWMRRHAADFDNSFGEFLKEKGMEPPQRKGF